jgi:hypothetical protein
VGRRFAFWSSSVVSVLCEWSDALLERYDPVDEPDDDAIRRAAVLSRRPQG